MTYVYRSIISTEQFVIAFVEYWGYHPLPHTIRDFEAEPVEGKVDAIDNLNYNRAVAEAWGEQA